MDGGRRGVCSGNEELVLHLKINQNVDFLEAREENPSEVREQVIVSDAREQVSKAKAGYGWCGDSNRLAAVDLG